MLSRFCLPSAERTNKEIFYRHTNLPVFLIWLKTKVKMCLLSWTLMDHFCFPCIHHLSTLNLTGESDSPWCWKSIHIWLFSLLSWLVSKFNNFFAFLSRCMLVTQTGTPVHGPWDPFPHRSVLLSVNWIPLVLTAATSVPSLYCNWEKDQVTNIASPVYPLLIWHSPHLSYLQSDFINCLEGAAPWLQKQRLQCFCKWHLHLF